MSENKIKAITAKGILQEFGICKKTFYDKYKPFIKQIPTTGRVYLYDYQSVVDFHKKRITKGNPQEYEIIA